MFDRQTEKLLRSAPPLPGLDAEALPEILTAQYANLVSRRLRGESDQDGAEEAWPLSRIADTYELVAALSKVPKIRRGAAFVAGTAQQILARELKLHERLDESPLLCRDSVHPAISAALLFMISEQYADAHEAGVEIFLPPQGPAHVYTVLVEHLRDLVRGRLNLILGRAARRNTQYEGPDASTEAATIALYGKLVQGVELLAAEIMSEEYAHPTETLPTARSIFDFVKSLCVHSHDDVQIHQSALVTTFPGPNHLASLLSHTARSLRRAAVTKLPPPTGADPVFWRSWLKHRADIAPFLWRNHRFALKKQFHETGKSAILVLPTGAGKTTISCIKIAGTLARKLKVLFIAPTHALVDQLTEDLQEMFPESLLGSVVSSDFDLKIANDARFQNIEVMTPERCLALLSYAPEAFEDVGLLVFDECHLLSPALGLRRALDGMFCLLTFSRLAPNADLLFLSAMVKNGEHFAAWIASLTGRECVHSSPSWKPSRQARGVVVYPRLSINQMTAAAKAAQIAANREAEIIAKGLRKAAKAVMRCDAYAIFGLRHNWFADAGDACKIVPLAKNPVALSGKLDGIDVVPLSNVNDVAAELATLAASNNMKTIVFANTKPSTVKIAKAISKALPAPNATSEDEQARWDALKAELGALAHSLIPKSVAAVPHNSDMLALERGLAERLFKRADGARVIVATPTLAQGLNLPAQLALLAGDKRADPQKKGVRATLEAHELLNAAARAGRAGHLANGIVLLIPEGIISFKTGMAMSDSARDRLASVLPEDDRCLDLTDPLQHVLDAISEGESGDVNVEYALNRLSTAIETKDGDDSLPLLASRSLAAFAAKATGQEASFKESVTELIEALEAHTAGADDLTLLLATQSGASPQALDALRLRVKASLTTLPATFEEWVAWVFAWLMADEPSRIALLARETKDLLFVVGRKSSEGLDANVLQEVQPGILAWIKGQPLADIERALGATKLGICPRARRLVTKVIPLGITFIFGLVIQMVREMQDEAGLPTTSLTREYLGSAVRRGYDTPAKLAYAGMNRHLLSRVQVHTAFAEEMPTSLHDFADHLTLSDVRTRLAEYRLDQAALAAFLED